MSFFMNNKTKLMGLVIVIIGFLQLSDNAQTIKNLLGEEAFSVWNLIAGAIVVGLGFLNSATPKE